MHPDAGDALGNRHARQTTAAREGTSPNTCDAIWDRHARQTTAAREGTLPNTCDAVRNCVVTAFECGKFNQHGFVFIEQYSAL